MTNLFVPRNVFTALSQLRHAELVRATNHDAQEYIFKHALVQETVHATLLKNENRRLHKLVAHALEKVNAGRLDEYAAQLAHHFFAAEDDAKTLEYSQRAGDNAARIFANEEALTHYARAIEIAKRGATTAQLIHLYNQRGRVLEVIGKYHDAMASYQELHEFAQTRHDRALELASLMLRATLHSAPLSTFDAELAKQLLLDALGTARELGDEIAEARVLWNLALLSVHTMHPADGVMYGELSLALAEKLKLREQMAYALHDLFIPYRVSGQIMRAREVQAQARALWRELDNKPMLADNLGMAAQFAALEGEFARAVEFGAEGAEISRAIGNHFGVMFNQSFLASVHLERGEYAETLRLSEEMLALTHQSELNFNPLWLAAIGAWIFGQLGAFARSLEMESRARRFIDRPMPPSFRAGAYGYLARWQLLRGDVAAAKADLDAGERDFDWTALGGPAGVSLPIAMTEYALAQHDSIRALQILETILLFVRQNELRGLLPELLLLQGRAYAAHAQNAQAIAVLQEARSHAQAIGARRTLWQILAALGEMERARGNLQEAEVWREHARAEIDFIVAHTPKEFRESFLNLPRVREVMA